MGQTQNLNCQGSFFYDSKKTDGITISHLRMGNEEIKAGYKIVTNAHFISISNES